MTLGPPYVLLEEVSVQVLYPFLYWVVCLPGMELCEFFIYFGDQTLVQGIIYRYISPHSWFPYHFVDVLFSCVEAFILIKSHLFILSFVSLTLGNISVKILLHGISEIFLIMFFSRTFMMSQLIFKSFIHPEFISCVWCKLVVEFHFFACSCPGLPTPFVEEAIFTPFYASPPFVKY